MLGAFVIRFAVFIKMNDKQRLYSVLQHMHLVETKPLVTCAPAANPYIS